MERFATDSSNCSHRAFSIPLSIDSSPIVSHTNRADDKKILFLSYTVRCDNHSFRKSLSLVKKNFAVYIRDRLRTQDRTLIHERSRAIYESINSSHRDFLTDIRVRREKRRRCKKRRRKKRINAGGNTPSLLSRFSTSNQTVRKRVEDVINSRVRQKRAIQAEPVYLHTYPCRSCKLQRSQTINRIRQKRPILRFGDFLKS